MIPFAACASRVRSCPFLLCYPPTIVLSETIGALKNKSASALLNEFGSQFWGKHVRTPWSSGLFLCSVGGRPLEILQQYIEDKGAYPP